MTIADAITLLQSNGYRVIKARTPKCAPTLNAVGKPFNPSYDPNYRMKYRAGSTAHLFKPYGRNMIFVGY
jgi:hypothetical protein